VSGSDERIEQNGIAGYVLQGLTISLMGSLSVLLSFMFPYGLNLSQRTDVFRALAEVGGALIGFVGIVGVFGLGSVRSAVSDIGKLVGRLQTEERRLNWKSITGTITYSTAPSMMLDFEIDELRHRAENLRGLGRIGLVTLFLSLTSLILEICSAILGLAYVTLYGEWRWLLFFTFYTLFAGSYFLYMVARITTLIPP